MKKIFSLLLSLTFILSLVACGTKDIQDDTSSSKECAFVGTYKKDVDSWQTVNRGRGNEKVTTEIYLTLKEDGTAEKVMKIAEKDVSQKYSHLKYGDVVERTVYNKWSVKGNEITFTGNTHTLYCDYKGYWQTEPTVFDNDDETDTCKISGNQLVFNWSGQATFTKVS